MKNKFTIVVPFFNEEKRFKEEYFKDLLDIRGINWIFVDDGSTDGTQKLLTAFCNRHGVILIKLSFNQGKAEAIRNGLNEAKKYFPKVDWLGYLDSDGAFDKADIKNLYKIASEDLYKADAYFSSRIKLSGRKILRTYWRHIFGRIIVSSFSLFVKDLPYDTQSGFKFFKANDCFFESIKTKFTTKWFIDLELIIRMSRIKSKIIKIWEEPAYSWSDIPGSNINTWEILRLVREILYIQISLKSLKRIFQDNINL